MDDTTTYGTWVRRRRRELDLTQAELAHRVGCALTTIEKLEADARRPSKAMAERLADALDLAPGTRPGFLSSARSGWMGEETGSRTHPAPADHADLAGALPVPLTSLIGRMSFLHPETHYAKNGDISIAYQVIGNGPLDLVNVPGWISHVEYEWEDPYWSRYSQRLATFSRLIRFDKRGTGLSDRAAGIATMEERMDDIRAVMDAAGSERAAVMGSSEGGPLAALFAATYPERTAALVLWGAHASVTWAPDYPWKPTREEALKRLNTWAETSHQTWGHGIAMVLDKLAPSIAEDAGAQAFYGRLFRLGASPGAALMLSRMNIDIDVRHILPTIHVPTLVLHRTGDRMVNVEEGRYLAAHIPGAKLVELPGDDHAPWIGDMEMAVAEIQEFLTGVRPATEPDRVLATVLFTDIVGSTERAAALGDRRWRELLEQHHAVSRRELVRARGREVRTTRDGLLATFDGPARAIRCAVSISREVRRLGLDLRAGLHTGECELVGSGVEGIALHIGTQVAAAADPNEVLVSSTVKDLVAGSGLAFTERGTHILKGVAGTWHLFAVALDSA